MKSEGKIHSYLRKINRNVASIVLIGACGFLSFLPGNIVEKQYVQEHQAIYNHFCVQLYTQTCTKLEEGEAQITKAELYLNTEEQNKKSEEITLEEKTAQEQKKYETLQEIDSIEQILEPVLRLKEGLEKNNTDVKKYLQAQEERKEKRKPYDTTSATILFAIIGYNTYNIAKYKRKLHKEMNNSMHKNNK